MKKNKKIAESITAHKNRLIVYLLLLILVPSILYFRVVNFGFSNLDDQAIISTHYSIIGNIKNIGEAFTHDAFMTNEGNLFYRPLQTVSFMIDAQAGGDQPWIYHLSNLLLHVLTVIVLFFLLKKVGIREEISFMLSLFFSINPMLTNAVSWIPARGDLLLGLFCMLSFITFLDYLNNRRIIYFIMHSCFFLLAVFSKETAILLPVVFLLYTYFVLKNKFRIKEIIPFAAVWIFTFALYYILRMNVVKASISTGAFGIIPFIKNLPVIPITFGKFFVPIKLCTMPFFDITNIVIGCILLIGAVIFSFRVKQNEKRLFIWGAIWFLIFTVPPMVFRTFVSDIGYEYFEFRGYLPSVGILVLLGTFANTIPERISISKFYMILMPVLLVYAITAFTRSSDFADPVSFFSSAINGSPNNAMALNSRGCLKADAGNKEGALEDFDNSIRVSNIYSDPFYNKGEYYNKEGDLSKAELFYSSALKYDTLFHYGSIDRENTYINISATQIMQKKYDEALIVLKHAMNVYPGSYKIFNNIGKAYFFEGKYDSSIIGFNRTIEIKPSEDSYNLRAMAKYHLSDYTGALNDLNSALQIKPDFRDALTNRGITKIELKDYQGAVADFNIILSINPRSGVAYHFRGIAFSKMNNTAEADRDLNEAIKLGFRETDNKTH